MDRDIRNVKFLARLLDTQFEVGGIKFGLDPVINVVPWLGDIIGAMLSLYILKIANDLGVSKFDYFRMLTNIAVDFLVGLIPFLGIIFDVFYKANVRNIKILEKYTKEKFVEGKLLATSREIRG